MPRILLSGLLLFSLGLHAQKIADFRFSYDPVGQSLPTLIHQAESNFPVTVFYKKAWIDSIRAVSVPDNKFLSILQASLSNSGFRITIKDDYYLFIYPDDELITGLGINPFEEAQVKETWVEIGDQAKMQPGVPTKLTGYVSDATGEVIPGVTISVDDGSSGTISSPLGYYQLELLPGNHAITYNYLGFESEQKKIKLYSQGTLNINLYEETSVLEEITVEEGGARDRLTNTSLGKSDLSIYAINKMPAFMGESDVIKSITILPGVSVTGESSSYISVRGGNYDQNLILMNDIPIYNPSHLLGFFSVFNPDMVSKVSLYKGSVPARYESRASSVLDVKLSPRASSPFMAYGGIGILTSSLGAKGKVLDDKLTYTVGSRATYSDWVLDAVPDKDAKTSAANFWDFNSVIEYQINSKNSVKGTFYKAKDSFQFSEDTTYSYDQVGFSLAWNHLFSNDLLYNLTVSHSDYQYETEGDAQNYQFLLKNGIQQSGIQNNLTFSRGMHALEAGVHLNRFITSPGSMEPNSQNSLVVPTTLSEEHAVTVSGYLEDEVKLTESLRARVGLRYTNYQLLGPLTTYTYAPDSPRNETTTTGEISYDQNEKIANYHGMEPRASISYLFPWATLKLGYNRLYQFQHLISNSISVTPLDQWKLSDQFIKPVISDQLALGVFKNFQDNTLEASVEGYVKHYQNLIEYKNGANIVLNESLEQVLISGEGKAWGLEFLLAKNKGRTQGWFSYAYSRTFIRTQSRHVEERINEGAWYPYYSDRPHNISLSLDHKITNRWSMGINFKYASGRPVSAPAARFVVDNVTVAYFNERNGERIPDYHRADISLTHENKVKKNQQFRSKWVISVYNLYARKNAYSIFFKNSPGAPAQPYKLTIAGGMIPSLTYRFEFN